MRKIKTITMALIAVALMASSAVAVSALATTHQSGKINNFKVASSKSASSTASTSYVAIPGAQVTMNVPAGKEKYFLATFTTESRCTGTSGWCTVRILIDGVEMSPAVGTDFAFDTPGNSYRSLSVTRVVGPVTSGTHTIKAEYALVGVNLTNFWVDDWTFTVLRAAG